MIQSFLPIVYRNSKLLILGSIPGIPSLNKQEYYGNKNNAFWRILFTLFTVQYSENYSDKQNLLKINRIALWDSVNYCQREGSLDSAIKNVEANDISGFILKNNQIDTIVFNGKSAEKYFRKYNSIAEKINLISLPSTSPANARLNFQKKLEKWKVILDYL